MATVQKFEDLICWQKARELTKFVYEISKYRNFDIDRELQDQIRRAAVSVMSNIAKGFDRATKFELINYFYIAKGSCGEVRSQLYIALDSGYIDMSKFQHGIGLCDECSRLIQSFIYKVKSGSKEGLQFKREKTKRQIEAENFLDDIKNKYLTKPNERT
jgi:four helix bundle protein